MNFDQLGNWAKEWLMEFDSDKYKVLHFRKSNPGKTLMVNGRALESVVGQSKSTQFPGVESIDMLAFISQGIGCGHWYTLVLPHMEYCSQFWPPCYRIDAITLKREGLRLKLQGLEGMR